MFTGITQEVITIQRIETEKSDSEITLVRLHTAIPQVESYALGDSIMMNGICSTVTKLTADELTVEFMAETLQLTTVLQWATGDHINIEAPATLASKLSGSLVTGHVDTVGTVTEIDDSADYAITVQYPAEFSTHVIHKGSITLNGVNLTVVAETQSDDIGTCTVKLIPFTKDHTNLGTLTSGSTLNVEFDYVAKIILHSQTSTQAL